MDLRLPFGLKKLLFQFLANFSIWGIFCIISVAVLWRKDGFSLFTLLAPKEKLALFELIDCKSFVFFLVACAILISIVLFIKKYYASTSGKKELRHLLDKVFEEATSTILSFGSILFFVSWFTQQLSYTVAAIVAWIFWGCLIAIRNTA